MERIRFPHRRDDGQMRYVDLITCTKEEWALLPESKTDEWSVCEPEPGSTDLLIRATRLFADDGSGGEPLKLRLVGS